MSYCLQKNRVFRAHGKNWHLNYMSASKSFMMLSFQMQTRYYGVYWIWHSQNSAHHYTKKFGCFWHPSLLIFSMVNTCWDSPTRNLLSQPQPPIIPYMLYVLPHGNHTTGLYFPCNFYSLWSFLEARPAMCLFSITLSMCWFLQVLSQCHAYSIPSLFPCF